MTKDGLIRIYNFTIIDSHYNHIKYLREQLGIKKFDNKTLSELENSAPGDILRNKGIAF